MRREIPGVREEEKEEVEVFRLEAMLSLEWFALRHEYGLGREAEE